MQRVMENPGSQPAARYLCVSLAAERYAIPILSVREIQAFTTPTPLPRMPAHVLGVANLHGDIVPVVDLRQRMGMTAQPFGRLTVTVFVAAGSRVVGLIVDAASQVLDIERAQLKQPPEMADGVDISFIAGIARRGAEVTVVLDVDALLNSDPALAAPPDAAGPEPRRESP